MKKIQWEGLARRVLPSLPGYQWSGWFLHRPVREGLLSGFCCDHSGVEPDRFALVAFAFPLFMPPEVGFHLNFGRRLRDASGREARWDRLEADPEATLIPALLRADAEIFHPYPVDTDSLKLLRFLGAPADPYLAEATAFCHARAGRFSAARRTVQNLLDSLNAENPWHQAMADRLSLLDSLLNAPPDQLAARMEGWIETHRLHLRLR